MSAQRRPWGPLLALGLLVCGPLVAGAGARDDGRTTVPDIADTADAPPAGTGDAWIDLRLDDMDRYAARYREAFIDEIARYLEAPRPVLVEALERGMRPGDLYYACALARAAGRSCRSVVNAWRANPGGGWPDVAVQLELGPGDGLHARIREDVRASYRRWARPDSHLGTPAG